MLRRALRYTFWIAVICLAANVARVGTLRVRAFQSGHGSDLSPYTAVTKETVYNADGSKREVSQSTVAVRSDGSRVTKIERTSSGYTMSQRTIELSSGEQAIVDDIREIKSTTKDPAKVSATPQWLPDPRSRCLNSFSGQPVLPGQVVSGEEIVNGYRAAKLQKGNMTWWLALDHGCAMLKRRAQWGEHGQIGERTLVSLTAGEPQGSLFHVPQGYRELPPSGMVAASTSPETANQRRAALARADEWYQLHRP